MNNNDNRFNVVRDESSQRVNRKVQDLYKQYKKVSKEREYFQHQHHQNSLFEYSDLNNLLALVKVFLVVFNVGIFIYILYLMKRKYSKETILSKLLNQQQQPVEQNSQVKKVALIIAHPDDEAMFFSPVLLSLVEQQISVSILCLSIGNFDGMGEKRISELKSSCSAMGLTSTTGTSSSSVKVVKELQDDLSGSLIIVDNDQLLDGMDKKWNDELISNFVGKFVEQNGITTLLTFDEKGISNHPNHVDVFKGVSYYSARCKREQVSSESSSSTRTTTIVDIFTLESVNFLRKYLGIIEFVVSLHFNSDDNVTLFTPNPFIAWKAMSCHESQFVWFRKLFVLFSRYTFVNSLTKLNK